MKRVTLNTDDTLNLLALVRGAQGAIVHDAIAGVLREAVMSGTPVVIGATRSVGWLAEHDEITYQARRACRIETLRELATLADAGIEITADTLREMAEECRRATERVNDDAV